LLIDRDTVAGVEFIHDGQVARVAAASEVVLSLSAVHTLKVLL
jgi:choline dehydrogenase